MVALNNDDVIKWRPRTTIVFIYPSLRHAIREAPVDSWRFRSRLPVRGTAPFPFDWPAHWSSSYIADRCPRNTIEISGWRLVTVKQRRHIFVLGPGIIDSSDFRYCYRAPAPSLARFQCHRLVYGSVSETKIPRLLYSFPSVYRSTNI